MSCATGEIWQDQKLVGWFEYNGTVDFACSRVYGTRDELIANWRGDNIRRCTCCGTPAIVMLYSSYGGGYYWPGKVCFRCAAIVDGWDPDGTDLPGRPPGCMPPEEK